MQTEEVVPRAQSTDVDCSLSDSSPFQHRLHHSPHLQCSIPPLIHMAVKQEPQEEEERGRDSSTLSPQTESGTVASSVDNGHGQQSGPQQMQGPEGTVRQPAQDSGNRTRNSRGRRKSRWKLKFHHQALPPEYLDHYEASLAQEALNSSPTHVSESTGGISSPIPTISATSTTPSPIAHVHDWLQRIAAMQQELCPQIMSLNGNSGNPQNPNSVQSCTSSSRRSVITSTSSHTNSSSSHSLQTPRPPMKYSDLPYMGEITLDNSKPRRGRKPKKADICHLIYKNYGTILPGTPGHEDKKLLASSNREKPLEPREHTTLPSVPSPQVPYQRTDIQNRISSLLEKRLTQESRKNSNNNNNNNSNSNSNNNNNNNNDSSENHKEQDEPLNLCIRDLNQLKIRLLRKYGNFYESGNVKSEASSDGEEIECLGSSFRNSTSDSIADQDTITSGKTNDNVADPMFSPNPDFVYWPNAGVFIHPMALQSQLLYYQNMSQSDPNSPTNSDAPKEQKIVPKSIYSMMVAKAEGKCPTPVPSASLPPTTTTSPVSVPPPATPPISPRPKRNAPISQGHQQGQQPTKRKRSAIFIPPMPTENNNNPATEVSICKFKFTGGAKPSLQEKKSLSVDSGGNFRYYSGTGDKSMRGYEFFPRETLQQPAGQSGSSSGAFLNAAGERITTPICQRNSMQDINDNRRKRKSRKSLQREKLEQTFKEKGFLIQTQQLESAEGATYCKFRQLRKFTRYLFRSWKDYLPGNVRDLTATGDAEGIENDMIDGNPSDLPLPVLRDNAIEVPSNMIEDSRSLSLT